MRIIEKVIQSNLEPTRQDVVWIDTSDPKNPVVKLYVNGKWELASSESEEVQYLQQEIDQIIEELAGEGGTIEDLEAVKEGSEAGLTALQPEDLCTEITWYELKQLRDNGNLIPGARYRITDYTCTTTQTNTQSAGHVFDIIVMALDESTLYEQVSAILHSGDTYFADSNLSAWKIWYSIDNDTDRFDWADSTNGKGVIYRMIDEFNNDVPYDFKNILFTKYNKYTNVYTFTYTSSSTIYDASISGLSKRCYGNVINICYSSYGKQQLNFVVFYSASNFFSCYFNTFGNDCSNNTFDHSCQSNAFGNRCQNNTFSNNCEYNTFGNDCKYNDFHAACTNNTFGNSCEHNSFRADCEYNTFDSLCSNNYLGEHCSYNTFGIDCYSIKFGDSSDTKSYYQHIIVENGNRNIYLNCIATTSLTVYYQNVVITQGVNNTYTWKTITDSNVNQSYQTTYRPADSQTISV